MMRPDIHIPVNIFNRASDRRDVREIPSRSSRTNRSARARSLAQLSRSTITSILALEIARFRRETCLRISLRISYRSKRATADAVRVSGDIVARCHSVSVVRKFVPFFSPARGERARDAWEMPLCFTSRSERKELLKRARALSAERLSAGCGLLKTAAFSPSRV